MNPVPGMTGEMIPKKRKLQSLEFGYYTNPNLADSDGDGHDDGKEVAANTDPNNPLSRPMPFMKPPSKAPGAPPAPDYVDTITSHRCSSGKNCSTGSP